MSMLPRTAFDDCRDLLDAYRAAGGDPAGWVIDRGYWEREIARPDGQYPEAQAPVFNVLLGLPVYITGLVAANTVQLVDADGWAQVTGHLEAYLQPEYRPRPLRLELGVDLHEWRAGVDRTPGAD